MTPGGRIAAAIEVLSDMQQHHRPATEALRDWGRTHRFAGSGDRAAIGNLVFDALRHRASACWLMDDEITEVCGMGNQMLSAGSQYRFPDTIVALMRFKGGALAKNLTTLGPQRTQLHALELYGTKLTFVNDMPHGKLFRCDQPEDEEAMTVPYPAIEKGDLLPDFIAAIREGREPNVSARDVFRVMDVCLAAWESVEKGRTVPVSYLI